MIDFLDRFSRLSNLKLWNTTVVFSRKNRRPSTGMTQVIIIIYFYVHVRPSGKPIITPITRHQRRSEVVALYKYV